MSLVDRTLDYFKSRRERLLNGSINSIPSPFKRFRNDFIGIEQGKYICVTSSTKGAKTQFTSYVFLYTPILYAYEHPEQLRLKIFYYPLEESKENIIARFMSFLLFTKSGIRISPTDLKSTDNSRILDPHILELLKSEEYRKILNFFEKTVIFSDSTNPSGVWFECKRYAQEHGKTITKKQKIKGPLGETVEVDSFDYYLPDDPEEYKIIFYDHVSLISPENGMSTKQAMDKLSEYCVILRNKYNFTPVIIQQQAFAGESLDAFKQNKVRPTVANLSDSKYISRDANLVLGLFSPYKHELKEYMGYDITKLKDNVRFLEILVNRDGGMGGLIALFFDGATCTFKELPKPSEVNELTKVYKYVETLNKEKREPKGKLFFTKLLNYGEYLFNPR